MAQITLSFCVQIELHEVIVPLDKNPVVGLENTLFGEVLNKFLGACGLTKGGPKLDVVVRRGDQLVQKTGALGGDDEGDKLRAGFRDERCDLPPDGDVEWVGGAIHDQGELVSTAIEEGGEEDIADCKGLAG